MGEGMLMSLSAVLEAPGSPVAAYLRERFPNARDLQRRYRQAIAGATPLAPTGGILNYGTAGTAFEWRVRLLLDPAPDFGLAFHGAKLLGKASMQVVAGLISYLGGGEFSMGVAGPRPVDLAGASAAVATVGRSEEDLARACYALAFYTEPYRAGPLVAARSRLGALGSDVTLDQVLGLATKAEVADLVALTDAARRLLVPALIARGAPCYIGPRFAGSAEVGGADADVVAGRLLVELKAGLGDLRRGTRYCSLRRRTIHELLGYLLLDYHDAYRIETLGVYAARYAYLAVWPRVELLEELAGGPVDLDKARAGFRAVVQATVKPRPSHSNARRRYARATMR